MLLQPPVWPSGLPLGRVATACFLGLLCAETRDSSRSQRLKARVLCCFPRAGCRSVECVSSVLVTPTATYRLLLSLCLPSFPQAHVWSQRKGSGWSLPSGADCGETQLPHCGRECACCLVHTPSSLTLCPPHPGAL